MSGLGTSLQPEHRVGLWVESCVFFCEKHMGVGTMTLASLALDNWPGLFVIIGRSLK